MRNLDFFVIRTSLPLGYLAVALLLLGAAIFGLVQFWRGLRAAPHNRFHAVTGIALLFVVGLVLAANLDGGDSLELNPVVAATDLQGGWEDEGASLNLGSDGTYTCRGCR